MKGIIRKILIDWSAPLTLLFAAFAIAGVIASRHIELKLSLTDLLPQDHPNVQKFNKLVEVVGGVGYVEIILHAEDGKSHLEIAPTLVEKLKSNDLVRSAFFQREEYFFLTRALYYLDLPKLNTLEKDISSGIKKAKRKVFDIGLWDEEETSASNAEGLKVDPELKKVADRYAKMSPYLLSADGKSLLLMVKPNFDSMDMGKNREISRHVEGILKSNLGPNVTYKIAGRYYGKVRDADMMESDMYILGIVSNLIMAFILILYFRSVVGVISIFIPVVLGLGFTALCLKVFIGHINIITGFLIGIIAGIGSDYGIHMLWRLRLEQLNPSSSEPDPLIRTLKTSGWANFVTIISTGLCFFFMCGSGFKAFSEFGFVCGVGLCSILVAKLVSFYWTSKLLRLEKAVLKKYPFSGEGLPILSNKWAFLTASALTIVLILCAVRIGFEFDFEKMMDHSKEVRETGHLVDVIYDRSTVPSAFAANSEKEAVEIENYLKDKYLPKIVSSIVSGATIVPADQMEKQVILKRIEKLIHPLKDRYLTEYAGIPAKAIRAWVDATPFVFTDVPIYIREALRGTSEKSYLLYIYPTEHLNTGPAVNRFAAMISDVQHKFPDILAGSDAGIFNDILELIQRDGIILLSLIFIFVGVFIWITMRNIRHAALCYVPFLLSLPLTVGIMAVTGVKFNIFNVALLPAFIAVGIEIPIQLMQRTIEISSPFKAVRDISVSLQLSLLTTAIGFGTLVFTRAGVLKSLGWISLIAVFSIWFVGVFLQPAILAFFVKKQPNSKA